MTNSTLFHQYRPISAFRKNPSLRDLLVRATLPSMTTQVRSPKRRHVIRTTTLGRYHDNYHTIRPTAFTSSDTTDARSSMWEKHKILLLLLFFLLTYPCSRYHEHEHRGNKTGNWSLKLERPYLIMGDSNIGTLPRINHREVQVDWKNSPRNTHPQT